MADTIISVKDARFSLSTKETYFQIKADQKAIATESKTHDISSAYEIKYHGWYATKPKGFGDDEWRNRRPSNPWILEVSPRSLNIVYGMLRGRAYREIEKTYREHNGPNKESIAKVLSHYGIDEKAFYEACGEVDYE